MDKNGKYGSKNKRGAKKRDKRVSPKLDKQKRKEALREKLLKERAELNAGYLIIRSDEERPAPISHQVERPQPTTEEKITKNLKAISLSSIIRQSRITSNGYDDAYSSYLEISSRITELNALIKQCRAPRGSDDAVKAEVKARRDALKQDLKEATRKSEFEYEKAIALERSADEYSYIVALLTMEDETNLRKLPRINEKRIDLTKEEELDLIERYLYGGKKKQVKINEAPILETVYEDVKTLKVLGGNRTPKKVEAEVPAQKAVSNAPAEKESPKPAAAASPAKAAAKKPDKKKLGFLFAIAAIVIIILLCFVKCGKEEEKPVVAEPVAVVAEAEKDAEAELKAAAEAEKAAEEARIKAEEEAKAAEEARIKAEEEAKAAEEARIKAEAEAKAKAEAEAKAAEEARIKAEAEAKAAADKLIDWNIYGEISRDGYSADLIIGRDNSTIRFDEAISDADAEYFLFQVASKHGEYLEGVTCEVSDGVAYIDYPFTIGEPEQLLAFDILNAETVSLVDSLKKAEEVETIEVIPVEDIIIEETPVEEESATVAVSEVVADKPEEPKEEKKSSSSVYFYTYYSMKIAGHSVDFTLGADGVTIKGCSDAVVRSHLEAFAKSALPKYSGFTDKLTIKDAGNIVEIKYPYNLSIEEHELVSDLLAKELSAYVNNIMTPVAALEPVAEVAPAVEPEPIIEAAPVIVAEPEFIDSIPFYSYSIDFNIGTKGATITYPSKIIYPSDLEDFAAFAFPKYSQYVEGVKFSFAEDTINVEFPYELTESDQKLVFDTVEKELEAYIEHCVAMAEAVVVEPEFIDSIPFYSYSIDFNIGTKSATITYPSRILYPSDLEDFAAFAFPKYSQYVEGVKFSFAEDTINVEFPYELTAADQKLVFDTVEKELEAYIEHCVAMAEAVVVEPEYIDSIPFYSYSIDFNIGTKSATIAYPSKIIYPSDLEDFAAFAFPKYSQYVEGVKFSFAEDTINVEFPYELTESDQKLVFDTVEKELVAYIEHCVAMAEAVVVEPEYIDSISFYGYSADFRIGTEDATVTYPSNIIYPSDLEDFAAFAFPKYSNYVEGTEFSFAKDTIEVDFPYVLTEADQKLVFDTVEKEVEAYLDYYLAKLEDIDEPIVVAEEVEKTPIEEAPVEEIAPPAPAIVNVDVEVVKKAQSSYPSRFNLISTSGVATSFNFNEPVSLLYVAPRFGIGFDFQNIISNNWMGLGLRADLATESMPVEYRWSDVASVKDFFISDSWFDVSADLKLMAYFGNDIFDIYLGGGAGYSALYNESKTNTTHTLADFGPFSTAWYATGNAGIRFNLSDDTSIGAEVNYKYLMPVGEHRVSADLTMGISF